MDKNTAKMIHTFEQAGSMMGQFAYLIGQYFDKLTNEGFTREEALVLCRSYQNIILKSAFANSGKVPKNQEEHEDDE
jgi:hypothetical protein